MSVQSFAFPLARRFVAGESVDDAIEAVRRLNADGMAATIDLLGEDVDTGASADRVRDGYLALVDRLAHESVDANLSLKLSALGLRFEPIATLSRFGTVLTAAKATLRDPFVRVDMEGSALVVSTLDVVISAFAQYGNTGPVLQAYLYRTQADVARMIAIGARVRLCKGAYREPPAVAMQAADQIRVQFLALAMQLLRGGPYPAIATHDPLLIAAVKAVAGERGIAPARFEFQLLYGVRPDLQRGLVRDGYRVRTYVPFGTHWARYFRRRVTERRANALFALRSFISPA